MIAARVRPTAFVALLVAATSGVLIVPSVTNAQLGCYCGQPLSGIPDTAPERPAASDCLFILNVGIGLQACTPLCICDVDASGGIPNATDALICLNAAVGIPDLLACDCVVPPCQQATACSEIALSVSAESDLDFGWSGDGHNSPLVEAAPMILRVVRRCGTNGSPCEVHGDCPGSACEPTCRCDGSDAAPCEVTGPVGNPKRCYRDMAIQCDDDADCPSPQPCRTFLGPPLPLSVAGTPLCVTTYFDEEVSGLVDPLLGTLELSTRVLSRPNFGISLSFPCPRCGPPSETLAIGDGFSCEGGPRNGEACTVGAVSPLFGGTSLDCPPDLQLATGAEYPLRLGITTGTKTLDATIPCGGSLAALHPDAGHGGVCLDTFTQCTNNDDCRRCTGLPSQACATNEDCSGAGACAAAPEQPVACGIYCHCGFCDGDPASPCSSAVDCAPGEECVQGSGEHQQRQNNACTSLICGAEAHEACCSEESANCSTPTERLGSCAGAPYRPCQANEDCAAGDTVECLFRDRPCFEGRIERSGSASPLGSYCIDDPELDTCTTNADCAAGECAVDTATPTAVALICVPATSSASVNAAVGLAGPTAMTLKTALRVYRCGDGTTDGTEECDDSNSINGDGCDEVCRVERYFHNRTAN